MQTLEIGLKDDISESMRKINESLASRSHFDFVEEQRALQNLEVESNFKKGRTLWMGTHVSRRHREFEKPNSGPWYDALMKLKPKLGEGFICVLMGNRGTGKTQLATSLIQINCIELLLSARYVKAIDIFISLREAYRKDGDSESRIISRFTEPNLLVIDAMEERGETPFEDRLLNHIIDKRYDNMSDTLLITNQTVEAFALSAGASIISRIHETGDKIICDWQSFRTKKSESAK